MDIIPVLDIRNGIVVHARRGERASYAPLRSPLLAGCEPDAMLQALLTAAARVSSLRPPTAAYVADLDGIVHGAPQWPLLERLRRTAPVPLWLDAGFATAERAVEAAERGFVPVIGSESLTGAGVLGALRQRLVDEAWLLSLDADADGPRDPAGVLQQPQLWPRRVIAMDLTRVGSEAGGIGAWLKRCMAIADDRIWIAAGGVRNRADLQALESVGVGAALVATGLHTGHLAADRTGPAKKNPP